MQSEEGLAARYSACFRKRKREGIALPQDQDYELSALSEYDAKDLLMQHWIIALEEGGKEVASTERNL